MLVWRRMIFIMGSRCVNEHTDCVKVLLNAGEHHAKQNGGTYWTSYQWMTISATLKIDTNAFDSTFSIYFFLFKPQFMCLSTSWIYCCLRFYSLIYSFIYRLGEILCDTYGFHRLKVWTLQLALNQTLTWPYCVSRHLRVFDLLCSQRGSAR